MRDRASSGGGPIWITGLGLVSSLGVGAEATWRRLVRGERGLRPLTLFDGAGQRATLVAEVDAPVPADRPGGVAWSRAAAFARLAAAEALGRLDPRAARVGLVVGGTTGGMLENELPIAALYAASAGGAPGDPRTALDPARRSHPLSSVSDALVADLGPFARVRTVASACSGGASAVVLGAAWLLSGAVDAVLVGGAEALCRLTLTGFNSLGVVDPEPCRPFDRRRHGLNLGEGAGFLLLERERSARSRGAEAHAALAGWALASEAHHVTNPEPTGAVAAAVMSRAMELAGVRPEEVDWISAHGTGTPLNDKTEALAIARAFGEHARAPRVSSNKAQLGHTLGAAAAMEAVVAALALRDGVAPPTAGLSDPDPECALRHVTRAERAELRVALSNAFGFGGMDSALVMTRPDALRGAPRATRRGVVISGYAAEGGALDAARARRIDPVAQVSVARAEAALGAAEAGAAPLDRARVAAVQGSAFGSVRASAALVHRILEKGPRFAPPAEFPNLVPSAPAGHVSIYARLGGPAMTTCDLGASFEAAFATGVELVAAGEADAAVCGLTAERSDIVDRVFAPLFGIEPPRASPGVVVESEATCAARGATPFARVEAVEVVPLERAAEAPTGGARSFGSLAAALAAMAAGEAPVARVVARRAQPWGGAGFAHVVRLVRP